MSHKLSQAVLTLFALIVLASAALAADPGIDLPNDPTVRANSQINDQKKGSVLIYNLYSSSATTSNTNNTRINITNTNALSDIPVHLFFVDGATCSIADSFLCLTRNQTASFLASDVDPGITGYIMAFATDGNGLPTTFDWLIGDEYVKLSSGHTANLGAEAISLSVLPLLNFPSAGGALTTVFFDGVCYNRLPRVLAVDNIPARADGNDTLLVLDRIGGSLATGASTLGPLFGILYDDAETAFSFTFSGGCQFRSSLSNTFPRTAPRVETVIPGGRSGWMKVYSQSDIAIVGSVINLNPNAGTSSNAFNGGHNLHKLTLVVSTSLTLPVFPPNCRD
jgi:hypothetical protein